MQSEAPAACPPADSTELQAPTFHTLSIDGQNGFHPKMERTPAGPPPLYHGYATWDDCRLYLGYAGPALSSNRCPPGPDCPVALRGASPHRFVSFYLDTDPLGEDGSIRPRRVSHRGHRLPFHADYLIEVRTDGRMVLTSQGKHRYRGNVQLYKNIDEWGAGLTRGWEPVGGQSLEIGQGREKGFLEVAVDRRVLGAPCAVEVLAWVTDTRRGARFGYWPPPDSVRSTPDSVALNYYGFPLVRQIRPGASVHLNRIDYSAAGTHCAQGEEDHQ